jgi:hypothetical protein
VLGRQLRPVAELFHRRREGLLVRQPVGAGAVDLAIQVIADLRRAGRLVAAIGVNGRAPGRDLFL